ncbi:hypothetical protein [Pseudomonas sp. NA-150]|uniref:hypothetical protein n=1 Tax=Pseudomonas sp. NA-150 TaxID=3367525 RepID=UPI0037CB0A56
MIKSLLAVTGLLVLSLASYAATPITPIGETAPATSETGGAVSIGSPVNPDTSSQAGGNGGDADGKFLDKTPVSGMDSQPGINASQGTPQGAGAYGTEPPKEGDQDAAESGGY